MSEQKSALEKAVKRELKRPRDEQFRQQLEKHRAFKERMRAAGVEYGDKFSIPLMARLGHAGSRRFQRSRQSAKLAADG